MPIIAPVKQKNFQVAEQAGVTNYKAEFLTGLMSSPALIRNVAIAGHLHHGKTVVSLSSQARLFIFQHMHFQTCQSTLRLSTHGSSEGKANIQAMRTAEHQQYPHKEAFTH